MNENKLNLGKIEIRSLSGIGKIKPTTLGPTVGGTNLSISGISKIRPTSGGKGSSGNNSGGKSKGG